MNKITGLRYSTIGLLVLTTLTTSSASLEAYSFLKMILLILGAVFLFTFVVSDNAFQKRLTRSIFFYVVLVFVFAAIWNAASTTYGASQSLFGYLGRNNGLITFVGLSLLALTVYLISNSKFVDLFLKLIVSLGVVEGIVSLYQLASLDTTNSSYDYNPMIGTFGNPNFVSAFMSFAFLASVFFIAKPESSRAWRITNAAIALFFVLVIVLSESQQGLIAIAGGMTVFVLHIVTKLEKNYRNYLLWGYVVTAISSWILFVLGIFNSGPLGPIISQYSVKLRVEYWHAAIQMFTNNVWTGVGMDSFRYSFPVFRSETYIDLTRTEFMLADNAHNLPLQLAATGGIFMLIAALGFYFSVSYMAVRLYIKSLYNTLNLAVLMIWVAWVIQSLLSINSIGIGIWGWSIAGAIAGLYATQSGVKLSWNPFKAVQIIAPAISTAIVLILVTPTLNGFLSMQSMFSNSLDLADPADVQDRTDKLVELSQDIEDPNIALKSLQYLNSIQKFESAAQLAKLYGEKFYYFVDIQHVAAVQFEQVGDFETAKVFRQRTVELDPRNSTFKDLLSNYP